MKKYLKYFLIILVIGFVTFPAHVLSHDDLSSFQQATEFRGIRWGSDTINYPYLFLKSDNVDGVELFGRECEKLTLGSVDLGEITYHFYNDQFYQVSIALKSDIGHQPLLDSLTETYGTPGNKNGMYVWGNDVFLIHLFPEGASISYLPVLNKITRSQDNN